MHVQPPPYIYTRLHGVLLGYNIKQFGVLLGYNIKYLIQEGLLSLTRRTTVGARGGGSGVKGETGLCCGSIFIGTGVNS
jgi:hypothetical protein